MATIKLAEEFELWASDFVNMDRKEHEMQINSNFFCNHCSSTFSTKDTGKSGVICPICDGYKVSLVLDLWNEPDPEDFPDPRFDSDDIPE